MGHRVTKPFTPLAEAATHRFRQPVFQLLNTALGAMNTRLWVLLIQALRGALLALVSRQTHFSLISRVLKRIESQYTENLSVDRLAAEANMSVSAFHHNFKSVTSTSPLQYLKTYRLHKARMLMIHDGMKASAAAMRVGYESASQFSREFKRYFGVTPGEDASRIRTMQVV